MFSVCCLLPQDDAALYRHLVALLRLCLMRKCLISDDTDELQGWAWPKVRLNRNENVKKIMLVIVYNNNAFVFLTYFPILSVNFIKYNI